MAESIAQDKDLTKMLLHAAGVPVPTGRRSDADDAWAAEEIGLPVVKAAGRQPGQGRGGQHQHRGTDHPRLQQRRRSATT
jgi:cyanophycin synthetase